MNLLTKYPELLHLDENTEESITIFEVKKPTSFLPLNGFYKFRAGKKSSLYDQLFNNAPEGTIQVSPTEHLSLNIYYLGEFFFYKPFSYFVPPKRIRKGAPKYRYLNNLSNSEIDEVLACIKNNQSNLSKTLPHSSSFKASLVKLIGDKNDFTIDSIKSGIEIKWPFYYHVRFLDKNLRAFEVAVNFANSGIKRRLKFRLKKSLDLNNNFVY